MDSLKTGLDGIEQLKGLDAGWDSYEAPRPDAFALKHARECLLQVVETLGLAYAKPVVGPTAEGGVALAWRKKDLGEVDVLYTSSGGRYVVIGRDREHVATGSIESPRSFAKTVLRQYVPL